MKSPNKIVEPSYSIREFCLAEQLSTPSYYKMRDLGLGPREMRWGAVVRISHQARLDWQRARENPSGAEAEAVSQTAARMRAQARAAAKRSVASPQHVSNARVRSAR